MNNVPLAKIIKTHSGRVFVYDGLTSRIISVKQKNFSHDDEILSKLIQSGLLNAGYLVAANWNISRTNYETFLSDKIPALVLQTTRSCNLRCDYCIYSGKYFHMRPHALEHMPLEIMLRSLDFYAAHSQNTSRAEISFYGGEPFLRFIEINAAVEHAKKIFRDKLLNFTVSTNGTLLNEEIFLWLADNPNVKIIITLNGTAHDKFRKDFFGHGSLKIIMTRLRALKEKFPSVFEKQVGFIANYFSFTNIVELREFYVEHIGKPPELINRIRRDMGNEEIQKFFPTENELEQTARSTLHKNFLDNPEEDFSRLLYGARVDLLDTRKIFAPEDPMRVSCCRPFAVRLFVQTDGKFNVCERTGDFLTLGDLKYGFDVEKIFSVMANVVELINRNCGGCWAQRLCLVCFQHLVDERGQICKKIPDSVCRDMRENFREALELYCELYG